jgi:hypothetical protein
MSPSPVPIKSESHTFCLSQLHLQIPLVVDIAGTEKLNSIASLTSLHGFGRQFQVPAASNATERLNPASSMTHPASISGAAAGQAMHLSGTRTAPSHRSVNLSDAAYATVSNSLDSPVGSPWTGQSPLLSPQPHSVALESADPGYFSAAEPSKVDPVEGLTGGKRALHEPTVATPHSLSSASTSLVTRALRGGQGGALFDAATATFASNLDTTGPTEDHTEALLAHGHSHIRLRWMPGEGPNSVLVSL